MKLLHLLLLSVLSLGLSRSEEKSENPSDLWYTGFLLVQELDEKEKQNQVLEALQVADKAFSTFKKLALDHPDFHPKLVFARLQLIASKQRELRIEQIQKEIKEIEAAIESQKEGLEIEIVPAPLYEKGIPRKIPRNWIPRIYDGETMYLIPLVETDETKAFSKLIPAPAKSVPLKTQENN